MHKCFWTLIKWVCEDSEAEIEDYYSSKDKDEKLNFCNSEDIISAITKILGPMEAYRTLGVHMTSSGNYSRQTLIIKHQVIVWFAKISS